MKLKTARGETLVYGRKRANEELIEAPNPRLQTPNKDQTPNLKRDHISRVATTVLKLEICLGFGIWGLGFQSQTCLATD